MRRISIYPIRCTSQLKLKAIKAIWFEIFSIGGQTQNCQIMLDGLIRQAVAILARWAHKFNW